MLSGEVHTSGAVFVLQLTMRFTTPKRVQPADVMDGMTTAVLTLDQNLRIGYLNSACENLFKVGRHHAVGHPLISGIPHFAGIEDRLRLALESGTGFIDRELELQRGGEEPLVADCTVTPFLSTSETAPGLLVEVVALDRHVRISREELQLLQHEASRELIRGLAHEVKNPLGGIRGAAQLLEREYPDSEHREYTRVIIREVDRLQNLVNRMLGPNRLPQLTLLNIHEVLEHVRKLIEAESTTCIQVVRDYDPSIPEISADREQLVQAVLNVARNALQACGDEGLIRLRTRMRRQLTVGSVRHRLAVQVDIEDNGPGVPPHLLDKIFYPMITTRPQGSGLGLPMAQYLIHGHGGIIECRSRPGSTVFSIYLPLGST